jgi:hypothetical protein
MLEETKMTDCYVQVDSRGVTHLPRPPEGEGWEAESWIGDLTENGDLSFKIVWRRPKPMAVTGIHLRRFIDWCRSRASTRAA